jgi:hypothetical protein
VLRATERNENGAIRAGSGRPAVTRDEDADIAWSSLEDGRKFAAEPVGDVAERVDNDEVDVLLGGDPDDVVAMRRRDERCGTDGSAFLGQRVHPLVRESCSVRESRAVSLEHEENQLPARVGGERLGNCEQGVECLGALGGDENRSRCRRLGCRQLGTAERRVLAEDGPFELLQRGTGLDAELLDVHTPPVPVGLERLGLSP